MLRIFDSLKSLISPELVSKASSLLGEDTTKVSTAIPTVIAGLLGALLHKGDTTQVKSVLEDAGKSNILTDLQGIFTDNISMKQKSIGNDFLSSILGTKKNDFDNVVASTTGMTSGSTSKLTQMIAPVVAGFLGNKLATNGYSLSGLLSQLNEEKHSFMGFIPSGVANIFGLSSVSDLGSKVSNKFTDTGRTVVEETPKGSSGWWKWLLLLILLLLLFFWWRSCNNNKYDNEYVEYSEMYVAPDTTVTQPAVQRLDTTRTSTQLTLSDGRSINAYRGGIEDQMINYLNNNYANASADDLKNKWFEFDNIQFAFGSANELTGDSQRQIDNIADILKDHKDVKVLIAGRADKVGSEAGNMALSRERAKYVESLLDKAGVGSQVVRTEGQGEQYATVSENASDAARAEDRDIALRFVK